MICPKCSHIFTVCIGPENTVFDVAPLGANERKITLQESFLAIEQKRPVIARIKVITGKVDVEVGTIIKGRTKHGYSPGNDKKELKFVKNNDRRWLPMDQITIDISSAYWRNAYEPPPARRSGAKE